MLHGGSWVLPRVKPPIPDQMAGEFRLFRVVKLREKSFGAASGVVARSGAR